MGLDKLEAWVRWARHEAQSQALTPWIRTTIAQINALIANVRPDDGSQKAKAELRNVVVQFAVNAAEATVGPDDIDAALRMLRGFTRERAPELEERIARNEGLVRQAIADAKSGRRRHAIESLIRVLDGVPATKRDASKRRDVVRAFDASLKTRRARR